MTMNEIARCLGYPYEVISRMFSSASRRTGAIADNLKAKHRSSTKMKIADYSYDETVFALEGLWRFTRMQRQVLKENFIEREGEYLYKAKRKARYSRDAHHFMNLLKVANGKRLVCATCAYLTARKINKAGSKDSPYCNFYGCFLNKSLPKRNIYKDRCESFEYSDSPPLVFSTEGVSNIDYTGKMTSRTLGIDNSRFTTGATRKGEPVTILNSV